ncbi:MAG: DUF4190 domain-containing protein [Myxococcales bacterium]
MGTYHAGVEPVPLKKIGTCKLAVAAGLFSLLCPTGIGGLIGLMLGILGLAQIRASKGDLGGAAMAWLGIVLGLAQVLAVGALFAHMSSLRRESPAVVHAFMSQLSAGDMESLTGSMTTGLRPMLDSRKGESVRKQLEEALGTFVEVGEANRVFVSWKTDRFVVEADYDLVFSKGAPASAKFTLVREYDALRVSAFEVRSPVIRVPLAVKGKQSQEVGEFSGGKAGRGRKLKEFK